MTPTNREPGLADVAERAGVSVTTVSRVLNNRGYLSQRTRDRVAQAIDELNYRPNEVARALLGQRTKVIGVVMPTVALPFFGEVAVSIEHALATHGYRMLLCNSLGRADIERQYLDLLMGNRVDGIISGAHNEDVVADYARIRLPMVTIDRVLGAHIPNVRADNEAGGRLATELLLRRGARRPALLTSRDGEHNLRQRGYLAVLADAGIEPLVATVSFHVPESERAAAIDAALDRIGDRIDAVFATDDLAAGTVLDWARRRGRSVPADLRVIGFDGTLAVRRALPGLSTVRQPIPLISRTAVDLLMGQIDAGGLPEGPDVQPVVFPVTLQEGWTT